jgi:hypothetical protein
MECRTCKFSKIDNIREEYSREVYPEMCCHRYAPRMIHGTGTGFSPWRFPQVSPDDFCGEYELDESKEN